MSLAGYSDKHGLSPEKWDLPVPSWAIAQFTSESMIKSLSYQGMKGCLRLALWNFVFLFQGDSNRDRIIKSFTNF